VAPVAQAEQSAVIQQNAGDRADAALRQGPDAIKDALAEAGDDPALAKALLGRAKTRVVKGEDDPPAEVLASAYSMRGCRARSWSRHDIVLPHASVPVAVIARQWVYQNGFCWNAFRISRSSGTSVRRTSAFPYCWKDTSSGEYFTRRDPIGPWYRFDIKRAFAQGTIGGNTGFGCVSWQSDRPIVNFNGVGGVSWR
jgi:hypothetical protein